MWTEHQLLQSIIKITESNDQDSLELNFAVALAELLPINHISLYRCISEDIDYLIEETICLDFHKLEIAELKNSKQRQIRIIEMTDRLLQCYQMKECVWCENGMRFLAPVLISDSVVGIILIESESDLLDYHKFLQDIIGIYENFLYMLRQGERDSLTGLRNRRTFDTQLDKLITKIDIAGHKKIKLNDDEERRKLVQQPSCWLVLIDIDNFKRINDKFGHLYGDEVLLLITRLMKKTFRDTDLLFRFGGEEFVVILLSATKNDAFLALERFRKKTADYLFPQIGQVTVSIGYSQISVSDLPITILDQADKALYFAKEEGKNQVCCYENLISQGKLKSSILDNDTELF